MQQYLDLLAKVRQEGELRPNRTGTDAYSIFGYQMQFDLQQGFPLLTTKKVHFPSVVHELLWFISGSTNIKYLNDNKVSIWDEWADERGELGPVYGHQWRSWNTASGKQIDQLKQVLESLRQDPHSRRHIVSAWNVGDLPDMALAPCHVLFQFSVSGGSANAVSNSSNAAAGGAACTGAGSPSGTENNSSGADAAKPILSCQLYQRSADLFLGVPFNIASYSLLTILMAHSLNMKPGRFIHTLGDVHLYANHIEQADEQLSRTPRDLPQVKLHKAPQDIFSITADTIELTNYNPLPTIKAPIAV